MLFHQKMELKFCINHVPFIGKKSWTFKVYNIPLCPHTNNDASSLAHDQTCQQTRDVPAKLGCFCNNTQS